MPDPVDVLDSISRALGHPNWTPETRILRALSLSTGIDDLWELCGRTGLLKEYGRLRSITDLKHLDRGCDGYVYAAFLTERKLVKFGRAKNVALRMQTLESALKTPVVPMAAHYFCHPEAVKRAERNVHRWLNTYRASNAGPCHTEIYTPSRPVWDLVWTMRKNEWPLHLAPYRGQVGA